MTPTFSIIIPVYNVEPYLTQCVESVLGQSYTDFEVLLVDDGSTDASPEICDKMERLDSRVRVFHKKNGGLSSTRNYGMEKAIGEYVLFLDSDDWMKSPEFLQVLREQINLSHPDCIFLSSKNVGADGVSHIRYGNYAINTDTQPDKESILRWLERHRMFPGAAWLCCIRSGLIPENKLYFPLGVTGEDYIWIIKLLECADTIQLSNDAVIMHRMSVKDSITSKGRLSGINGILLAIQYYSTMQDITLFSVLGPHIAFMYVVALLNYHDISTAEKAQIKSQLKEYASMLLKNDSLSYRVLYSMIKCFGLNVGAKAIALQYKIKHK